MCYPEKFNPNPVLLREQIEKFGAEYATYLVDRFECWLFLDQLLHEQAKAAIARMRAFTPRAGARSGSAAPIFPPPREPAREGSSHTSLRETCCFPAPSAKT